MRKPVPAHNIDIGVGGMDTGVLLFFHVQSDRILHMAKTWDDGIKGVIANDEPDANPDPAYQAAHVLRDMLLNHKGPVTPVQEAAAVFLFCTGPDPESVQGPSKITIENDGFTVDHVDRDLEKTMNHWQEKFSAVPAEDW